MNDGLLHILLTAGITAVFAVIGFLFSQTLRDLKKATEDLTKKVDSLAERLRLDELATKDVERDVALVKQAHGHLDEILDDIRSSMRSLEKKIDAYISARSGGGGGGGASGPGRYQQTTPPSEDRFPKQR